ncbi:MAG: peptidyl-prolyl cis-trans isomerase [Candidatus Omnitrophica bacterium]|jgi:peptidyl-prolyl cis-trans isomerase SurA|nr:peptidyl-prolyl cis-trans isomerase [Candidatus Omnitrophota bacterium]
MKKIIKFMVLAAVFSQAYGFIPSGSRLYAQDKVIAVVNNEVITKKDLNDFLNFMRMQYARQLSGKALEEKLNSVKKDLLQRLIEDRLILQQAKLDKIPADQTRVDGKVNEIKKHYSTDAEFQKDLAKQGLVQADLENKISEQILMYNFIDKKIRKNVVIRPDEITEFYEQNKSQFIKPEERSLTLIISADEPEAKIISSQLRSGVKIEDLSAKYSFSLEKLSASEGQQLRPEIESTVFKLAQGEVSDPVKVGSQYFIFRLDEIIGSRRLSLEEAHANIRAYLFEKKMQENLAKWLDDTKKQSYIKILEN